MFFYSFLIFEPSRYLYHFFCRSSQYIFLYCPDHGALFFYIVHFLGYSLTVKEKSLLHEFRSDIYLMKIPSYIRITAYCRRTRFRVLLLQDAIFLRAASDFFFVRWCLKRAQLRDVLFTERPLIHVLINSDQICCCYHLRISRNPPAAGALQNNSPGKACSPYPKAPNTAVRFLRPL